MFSFAGAAGARTVAGFLAFSTGAGTAAFARFAAGRTAAAGGAFTAFVAFAAFGSWASLCATGIAAAFAWVRTAGVVPALGARGLPAFGALVDFFGLTAAVIDYSASRNFY
ncbi:hypothetical protein [Massilia sp.]|uniref:hypothetical protein n=1 Tax=Massilia sp. TaxID=1882437 RepID=UPI0028997182|nr:hypothetical protein [Massilia sp.]